MTVMTSAVDSGIIRAPPSLVVTSATDTLDNFVASLQDHSADRLSILGLGTFLLHETWTSLNFLSASRTMATVNTCIGSSVTNVERTFLKDLRELASLEMFSTTTLRPLVPKGPRSLSAKELLLRVQVLRTAVLAQLLRAKCAVVDAVDTGDVIRVKDDGIVITGWQSCTNNRYLCPWPETSVQLLAASAPAGASEDLQWVTTSITPLESQYTRLMLQAHTTNSVLRTSKSRLQYQLVRSLYDQLTIAENNDRIPIEDACDAEFAELWRGKIEYLNVHSALQQKSLEERFTALSREEQRAFEEELTHMREVVVQAQAEKTALHDRLRQEQHRVQHLHCQLGRIQETLLHAQQSQVCSDLLHQHALEALAVSDHRLQLVVRGCQRLNVAHQQSEHCVRRELGERERECEVLRREVCRQLSEIQELRKHRHHPHDHHHHLHHGHSTGGMAEHEKVARDYAAKASAEVASLQQQLEEARRAIAASQRPDEDSRGCHSHSPRRPKPLDECVGAHAHPPTHSVRPKDTSPRLPAFVHAAAVHEGHVAANPVSITCVLHTLDELRRPLRMGRTMSMERASLAELVRLACASFDLPSMRIGYRDPPDTGPLTVLNNDHELHTFLAARRLDGVRPMVECCHLDGIDGGPSSLARPQTAACGGHDTTQSHHNGAQLDLHHAPQRPLSCGAVRANRIAGACSAATLRVPPSNLFVHSARPSRMMYSYVSEKALDQQALTTDFCAVSRGRPYATRADVLSYLDQTFETFGVPERHNSILNTILGPRRDGVEASRLTFNEFCVATIRASQL